MAFMLPNGQQATLRGPLRPAARSAPNYSMWQRWLGPQQTTGGNGVPIAPRAPKPPGAPQPSTGPAAPGAPQPPSNLDSTYYANTAANQYATNNRVNALNLQGSQANVALQAALAQLAYQQPRDQLRTEQGANARGGLYSSVFNQQLGDLNYQYAGRQAGLVNNYANAQQGNAAQIAALEGGVPLYNAQQAAASSTRLAAIAAKNPAVGGLSSKTTKGSTSATAPPAGTKGSSPARTPSKPLTRQQAANQDARRAAAQRAAAQARQQRRGPAPKRISRVSGGAGL